MKRTTVLFFVFAMVLTNSAHADKSTKILRGGLGFLFPDHNSFSNPGQFPLSYGMAVEAGYSRINGSAAQQLAPSLVYGNGTLGLGAYYARSGDDLVNATASSAGVGFGMSFLKDKLTTGVSYSRALTAARTNEGDLLVTANLNGPQRTGPSFGVGFGTTLRSTSAANQTGNVGVGYSFRSNDNIEAGVALNNIRDLSDYSPYVAGTFGTQFLYFGGSYKYEKTARDHQVGGRLGFILGRYIDLSAQASYVLKAGGAAAYGTTLRASF